MLDPRLVEDVAFRLQTDAGLVEKDWHVVRAIGVIAALDHGDVTPAFSGGTSLSKGWGLIKRFSEDIDFKLAIAPSASRSQDRKRRKAYRDLVLAALASAEFELVGEVLKGNEDSFFSADFSFQSSFAAGPGLRPHLRVEMTFQETALPPVGRPIRSLIGEALADAPEVSSFLCIDPIETAADKLSALAWRVCTRARGTERDDPTIIRHLHDLAALHENIRGSQTFHDLVQKAVQADTGRGGSEVPANPDERIAIMLNRLQRESFWAEDYDAYVRQVSYAKLGEKISFPTALDMLRVLIQSTEQE